MLPAKIFKYPRSKFWHALYYVYNAEKRQWERKTVSTKSESKSKAKIVADALQEVANKAGGNSLDTTITREYVLDMVNFILRVSGHPEVEETRKWDEYSSHWIILQKSRVTERTIESYEGHIRSFTRWLELDKNIPLNQLTAELCQTWYEEMIDEGRKPKTVNNAVKTLQGIVDRAKEEGLCARNPVSLILRQYGESEVREPFSLTDISKILGYLTKKEDLTEWAAVALLGLCTGQRLQDCANAALEHFVLRGEHIVWLVDQGKTSAKVDIPLVEPLASRIKELKTKRTSGKLCPSLEGIPSGGTNGLSMQFSLILDAAGIVRAKRDKEEGSKGQSWTNKTFHSFRHTTNSLLANAGVSDDVRKKILGHTTTKMNLRYTHLEVKTLAEALKLALPAIS